MAEQRLLPDVEVDDKGPWIMTFTGRHFHFASPDPDEVDIMDVAVATSREGRFAGHCWHYYSVAQHSVHVSERMEKILNDSGVVEVSILEDGQTKRALVDISSRAGRIRVAQIALCGLLHDASEAYLKDMPSPVKSYLPEYQDLEASVQNAIMHKYGIKGLWNSDSVQRLVHKVDKAVMACEVRDLIKHKKVWRMPERPYDDLQIEPVSPDTACVQFLYRFHTLTRVIEDAG